MTNDFYNLKVDLVKVEAEVYEFGRILQAMPATRAKKFKASLWTAWNDMQKIIRTFKAIVLSQTKVEEICE